MSKDERKAFQFDEQALRALFYACKLYSGTLKEGEYYKAAPHVYQIFLVDFDPFEDNGFYHRAMMRMDDGRVYSDKVQLLFFNLKIPGGMKKVDESLKKAAKWCSFISGSNKAEVIYDLGNDPDWKEEFKMAMKTYQRISDEERAWAYHLSYDRAETDYWNRFKLAQEKGMAKGIEQGMAKGIEQGMAKGIEQGMAKGIEQGMAQGELSGRQKTARNLLEMGLLTQEQISQATGLSMSEVQSLAVL